MNTDKGLVAVVKKDCPTCQLVAPVLAEIRRRGLDLVVLTQDDPSFPPDLAPRHDADLLLSHRLGIEIVPTLLRREGGETVARAIGWNREEWRRMAGIDDLGTDLPESRPGCGALNQEAGHAERLAALDAPRLSRRVELGSAEDDIEACFARGWSDGLPLVPPTPQRVNRMLGGTTRRRGEVVAVVPPNLVPCSVEKVAINAVMAGCRPEYLPVVLTAVEAACTDEFNMHGLVATTMPVGPVVLVNGPIRRAIGMNTGVNVLGQGNRANSTIGRALQLVIRNVGGGQPGGVDQATHGNPGKVGFCFAEDEEGSPWESYAAQQGFGPEQSTVTLFAGEGPRCVVDQLSRDPDQLARSLAVNLVATTHPKLAKAFDAILVFSPEHAARFAEAGWSKQHLHDRLLEYTTRPGTEIVQGANGIAEGIAPELAGTDVPKFRPDGGLMIVHAGGRAGLFSAIIGGWINGDLGSRPVTREIIA